MSEEERLNKRQKIEQNRARKRAATTVGEKPRAHGLKRNRSSSTQGLATSEWNATSSGTLQASR